MQFSYTTFLNLVKPAKAATGWADAVNGNFDKIDAAIQALASALASVGDLPCGVATFDGMSSKAVIFTVPLQATDYAVTLTPDANIPCWVTGKTPAGFTINTGSTFTGNVDWTALKF